MPSSLNCPNCGAPVPSADATRCEYCTSALTSVACPSCFGALFQGMQFCPHCGAKAARAVTDAPAPDCPSCKSPMRPVQIGADEIMECSSCSSTWLDAETFTKA